ncbi:hypothetical protein K474DRAFT_1713483 [Panus rudis PR-1116 ss-1]|nr:hypothetical protein K474DRAFT_1713483 [Panus rudis PR-1116 ss-1]
MSLFPLPTPEYTLGAGLILIGIGFISYGIMVVQTCAYMHSYPNDPKWLKSLVIIITLLETLFSALVVHVVYHFIIVAWGNFILVDVLFWSAPASPSFPDIFSDSIADRNICRAVLLSW